MNILITGGSTFIPIDKVRGITNIFKGRTACDITAEVLNRGEYNITLFGNPGMEQNVHNKPINGECRGPSFLPYKTYDELYSFMERKITNSNLDVIIHSAAVSDYKVNRVYPKLACGDFEYDMRGENRINSKELHLGGKISSSHKELIMELIPTEKIIDKIRTDWNFKGKLVKFKLQVDISDEELIEIAKKSREHSGADIIVANCLEWAREKAYIITDKDVWEVPRKELAKELLDTLEI